MIISDQHRKGAGKAEDRREDPKDKARKTGAHARSGHPQQGEKAGENDEHPGSGREPRGG